MAHVSEYDAFAPVYDAFAAAHDRGRRLLRRARRGGATGPSSSWRSATVAWRPDRRATGRRVIGIDVSSEMLEVARRRAADAGVELDLRQGDMRELALDEPTDLVICPFRAMLHLPATTRVSA